MYQFMIHVWRLWSMFDLLSVINLSTKNKHGVPFKCSNTHGWYTELGRLPHWQPPDRNAWRWRWRGTERHTPAPQTPPTGSGRSAESWTDPACRETETYTENRTWFGYCWSLNPIYYESLFFFLIWFIFIIKKQIARHKNKMYIMYCNVSAARAKAKTLLHMLKYWQEEDSDLLRIYCTCEFGYNGETQCEFYTFTI